MGPSPISSVMADSSMGMEVPFVDGALVILLLKGGVDVQCGYEVYLSKVNEGTVHRQVSRIERIADLPEDHQAKAFARLVGP